MKVKIVMPWGPYKKRGEVVAVDDREGNQLICTGVAVAEELEKPGPLNPNTGFMLKPLPELEPDK